MLVRRQSGFTLVELMIGVLLGFIVTAGAVSMFLSVSTATNNSIKTNRMQQELRQVSLVMTRDIQRAGYSGWQAPTTSGGTLSYGYDFNDDGLPDGTQTQDVEQDSVLDDIQANPYLLGTADIKLYDAAGTNDCILFTYFLGTDGTAYSSSDPVPAAYWFGYRRQEVSGRGVIQMKLNESGGFTSSSVDCTTGNWQAVTSDDIDVTNFTLALSATTSTDAVTGDKRCIRSVNIDIDTVLDSDNGVKATITDIVRVRNDKLVVSGSGAAGDALCQD